jgi:hypothetical protein
MKGPLIDGCSRELPIRTSRERGQKGRVAFQLSYVAVRQCESGHAGH